MKSRKAIHFILAVDRHVGERNDITVALARKNPHTVHIHWIAAIPKGKHIGSKLMAVVCDLADQHQIILTGDCVTERVANWFARYGFVIGRPHELDVDDFSYPVRRLPKEASA
jgi:N-acetylglutamate synthase-like GNAT family acetyltransferase